MGLLELGWLYFGFPESVEVELLESEGLELLASSSHSLNRTLHWLCAAADATACKRSFELIHYFKEPTQHY